MITKEDLEALVRVGKECIYFCNDGEDEGLRPWIQQFMIIKVSHTQIGEGTGYLLECMEDYEDAESESVDITLDESLAIVNNSFMRTPNDRFSFDRAVVVKVMRELYHQLSEEAESIPAEE